LFEGLIKIREKEMKGIFVFTLFN